MSIWTKPVAFAIVAWMRLFGFKSRKRVEEFAEANRGLRRDIAQRDAEIARLEHERDRLQHERARLASERDRLRRERDRLKQELAAAQRTRKRQAAPFSKGTPQSAPRKPGRKGGPKYGPKRRRDIPAQVDEELAAPLPAGCPACRGVVAHDRVEEQYQEAIVRTVRVTRIRVHIGHCVACGTRVQGRHPRQPSDALGAAAAQLGPDASALATLLNTQMGLSLGKPAAVLQQTFGLRVTPGGVSPAVARVGRQYTPTYAALTQRVGASASVTIDDTGCPTGCLPPPRRTRRCSRLRPAAAPPTPRRC